MGIGPTLVGLLLWLCSLIGLYNIVVMVRISAVYGGAYVYGSVGISLLLTAYGLWTPLPILHVHVQ